MAGAAVVEAYELPWFTSRDPNRVNASSIRRSAIVVLLLSALSWDIVGCRLTTQSSSLVVTNFAAEHSHPYTLRVRAAGGRKTEAWRNSRISDAVFLDALVQSLDRAGVFARVVTSENADYLLDVFIEDVQEPTTGLDVTVNLKAKWTVKNLKSGKVEYTETIVTPYTTRIDEALVDTQRLQLASEGAARENIREGILRISRLEL
jgi:hypothetical protein